VGLQWLRVLILVFVYILSKTAEVEVAIATGAEVLSALKASVTLLGIMFATEGPEIVEDATVVLGPVAEAKTFGPALETNATRTVGPAPIQLTVPLQGPGESYMEYGNRLHYENLPTWYRLIYPNAQAEFAARGQRGPDIPITGINAQYGELKSLWTKQSVILKQATEKWGLDPQSGRYFFYDRKTGFLFEGIFKTEWSPDMK